MLLHRTLEGQHLRGSGLGLFCLKLGSLSTIHQNISAMTPSRLVVAIAYVHNRWMRLLFYAKSLWPFKMFLTLPVPVEQTAPFLNLPVDILHTVCDELPLSTTILLALTCRDLWYTLRNKCRARFSAMTREDQLDTLTEMANVLPDEYHCITCNLLLPVASHDLPGYTIFSRHPYHRCHTSKSRDHLLWAQPSSYELFFHHVQLAMKYSRKKDTHQDYLKDILREYETHPARPSIIKTFRAKPKIVENKFILLMTYVLDAKACRSADRSDKSHFVSFCPQHCIGLGIGPRHSFATNVFRAAVDALRVPALQITLLSCESCPTDYAIIANKDEVVVMAWHDLGNGLSVKDPCWQSHVYTAENNTVSAKTFEWRNHASVVRMYDGCVDRHWEWRSSDDESEWGCDRRCDALFHAKDSHPEYLGFFDIAYGFATSFTREIFSTPSQMLSRYMSGELVFKTEEPQT